MTKAVLITTLSAVLFFVIGIIHLLYANKIAGVYRRLYPNDGFFKLFFPFRIWMESPFYVISMRVFGGISIAVAFLLLFVMIRGLLGG
jgi:hypothetical protein